MINVIIKRTGFTSLHINAGISKTNLNFNSVQQMRDFIQEATSRLKQKNHTVTIIGL
jgi:hypothetical protein